MEITIEQTFSSTRDLLQKHIATISGLLKLKNNTEKALLLEIWDDCITSNNFTAIIIKDTKQEWAKQLQCSLGTINNTITLLLSKGVIQSPARSVYTMNESFFFKSEADCYNFIIEYITND